MIKMGEKARKYSGMRWRILIGLSFLLLAAGYFPANSQDEKKQLENEKKRIEEEIRYTNELLSTTKKTRQASVNELHIINSRITKRESLIRNISNEIGNIQNTIGQDESQILELQNTLQKMKNEYAKMIYFAYRNRNSINRLMFILAAEDFNQAYKRMRYFQQYSSYRKSQAIRIKAADEKLHNHISLLENQKTQKELLLGEKELEKNKLAKEKEQKSQSVAQLKKKEKELLNTLKKQEKAARRLQEAIEKIIAEEIKKAREASKGTSVKAKPGDYFELTPEELELSNSFASNAGKLPWPSERGIIAGSFGEQPHPVLKGIKIKNNGVNILTSKGAIARAVFKGKVTRVMSVPNYNKVVIIRHGEYLSVYSNLQDVTVKMGDEVNTKQSIGTIFTNPEDDETELHFELWKGKILLNPSDWLAGKN